MSFYRVQDIFLDGSASTRWGVARWMFGFGFGFCTTAGVDVDVEQVSKRVLRSWLNVTMCRVRVQPPFNFRTSLHPKDKVSEYSTMIMCKMGYAYLRSLEDAPDGNVIVIVVV